MGVDAESLINGETGAGFYLNATEAKWKNWRMYDYVTKELPSLLSSHFPNLDTSKASLFGHSMGGHGALTIFLRNPNKYQVHIPFSHSVIGCHSYCRVYVF